MYNCNNQLYYFLYMYIVHNFKNQSIIFGKRLELYLLITVIVHLLLEIN
jgi:hypothetical protein